MHNIENKLGLNNIFLMPFKGRAENMASGRCHLGAACARGAMQRQRSIEREREEKVKRGMFHIFFYAKCAATFPLGLLYMPFGILRLYFTVIAVSLSVYIYMYMGHAILKIQ